MKYPVLSIKGPLLCGQEGLVPLDDHCTGPTLCPLSFVLSAFFCILKAASEEIVDIKTNFIVIVLAENTRKDNVDHYQSLNRIKDKISVVFN